ncbi:hypothetical protein BU14_1283s0004 [Porphyra umbilicalis]|uniref:Uncharacterized protein n=1 Tax=Porphyra umbilicalis TaxID=2786 RepID=A0A1X6NMA9_PORUM|nr:hypothetical protein BU14_1283s0004 [Porphyra umbilicalis]|eukprot:OSX69680.1 hypothetical protein BU14_1283s0004 [Porphyra umbilicalis]
MGAPGGCAVTSRRHSAVGFRCQVPCGDQQAEWRSVKLSCHSGWSVHGEAPHDG